MELSFRFANNDGAVAPAADVASKNARFSADAFGGGDSTLEHTTRPLEFVLEQLLRNVERHVACALRLMDAFFPKTLLVRCESRTVSKCCLGVFVRVCCCCCEPPLADDVWSACTCSLYYRRLRV